MNAYADSLLTVCLSWMRGVVRAVFGFFVSDQSHSFAAWLGDHWLMLVIVLCLLGAVIDWAVYLKRWKPYLLWGKTDRAPKEKSAAELNQNDFDRGFQDGVSVEPLFEVRNDPAPAVPIDPQYAAQEPEQPKPDSPFEDREALARSLYQDELAHRQPASQERHRRSDRHRKKNMTAEAERENGLLSRFLGTQDEEDLRAALQKNSEQNQNFYEPAMPPVRDRSDDQ